MPSSYSHIAALLFLCETTPNTPYGMLTSHVTFNAHMMTLEWPIRFTVSLTFQSKMRVCFHEKEKGKQEIKGKRNGKGKGEREKR